jgi:uncharacterized protein (DUF1015 family)
MFRFSSCSFPSPTGKILPFNRAIKRLPISTEEFLNKLREIYNVSETSTPVPTKKHECCLYLSGKWYRLTPINNNPSELSLLDSLEVRFLYKNVLQPILKIDNPRTNDNIIYVPSVEGYSNLEKMVDSKLATCAFSLFPTSVEEMMAISDMGLLMEPKSTYFES